MNTPGSTPAMTPAGVPMPSWVSVSLREAKHEFLRLLRNPSFAVPTLAFPLVFYLMFGVLIPGQWSGHHKATYMLATFATFAVVGPSLFGFGVGLAMERQNGWLELKRVSPMPIGAYFFAKIAMSLMFGGLVVVLLGTAAVWLGGVSLTLAQWTLMLGTLMLGALPFCALGLWIGSMVKGQAAVAIVNLVYMPMAVLSGLWMPLFVFPQVVQTLAPVWPAWHLSRLVLGVVGEVVDSRPLLHVGALLATTALFLLLAARRLRVG